VARFLTGLFGTKQTQPPATSLRVNTSLQGVPIALILGGKNRLAGNIIDYYGFNWQQAPASSGGSKGGVFGGGGKGQSGNYNYFVTFLLAICEGPVAGVSVVFVSGSPISTVTGVWPAEIDISTPSVSPGYTFVPYEIFAGDYAQGPWAVTEGTAGISATHGLSYRGVCYAAFDNYPLGSAPTLPNLTFEVQSTNSGAIPGQPDGDATVAWTQFLTNQYWGVGFPPGRMGSLTQWQQYCLALGLVVSPVLASATAASAFMRDLTEATNSAPCWQNGQLMVVPYGDISVTAGNIQSITETHLVPPGQTLTQFPQIAVGNFASFAGDLGVTYASGISLARVFEYTLQVGGAGLPAVGQYFESGGTYYFNFGDIGNEVLISYEWATVGSYVPDTTPIYDFTIDDFLENQATIGQGVSVKNSPLVVVRRPRDQMLNNIKVEYLDRSNNYNPVDLEQKDEASIVAFGRERPSDVKQLHFFCLGSAAQQSAQLMLIRQQIARTFQWTCGRHFQLILELMALATVTDEGQGLFRQPVRIIEIQENADASITVTAEEFLGTVNAPQYGMEVSAGTTINYNTAPGNANPPVIFEPTDELSQTLVSGGGLVVAGAVSGSDLATWGGCWVWASYDGVNYTRVGQAIGNARMGALTAPLPAAPVNPTGQTIDTADTLAVSLVESGGVLNSVSTSDANALNTRCYVGGEIVSYASATLTAANQYSLTYLVRGAYGTESRIQQWPAGTPFARLDGAVFAFPYDTSRIGATVYIKLQGYNIYQGGLQTLAEVTPYNYVLTGAALSSPLPTISQIWTNFSNGFTQISWTEISDFRSFKYEIRSGTSPGTAITLATVAHPPWVAPGDGTYWVAAVSQPASGLKVYSEEWVDVAISGAVITQNVVLTYDLKANSWPGTFTGGAGVDSALNAIRTGGGNILTDSSILATPDILNYGGGQSGNYWPSNVFVDIGYVTTPSVAIKYEPVGVPVGQNVLTEGSILGITDFLGAASTSFIDVYPLINVATSIENDLYQAGDLYSGNSDLYAGGYNWSGWQTFSPGQYHARFLNFGMFLSTDDPNTIAYDLAFTITVTIPARIDQYTLTTTTSGATAITFQSPVGTNAAFNGGPGAGNTPVVQGTVAGAQAGDTLVISSLTVSSLSVEVTNSGSPVARTVYLTVEGY